MVYLCGAGSENASDRAYGVTKFPTDDWTAQQVREATPWGKGPRYLIRDRDRKYAAHFSAVAASSGIQELKTPYRVPQANGACERFIGSLRRECLDHIFIHRAGICIGWSRNIWLTTIKSDPIRGLVNVFPHSMICQTQSQPVGASSRRRSWVDCIIVMLARRI